MRLHGAFLFVLYSLRMDESSEKTFELTASLEDYLEAIKELVESGSHGHAHTSELAKKLRVKMPSVTNALGVLRRHGYIHYDANHPVTLTDLGDREATRVMRRHRVVSMFLRDVLQLDFGAASRMACRIEHVIDERLVARLAVLTEELTDSRRCATLRHRLTNAFADLEQ